MGNGTSQSVVLGHSRTPAGVPYYHHRYQQKAPNYAHPHNRVLPKPVAGQRLRSTDNGHILHSAGTIRGLKTGSPTPPESEVDQEVVDALKKRSELLNKEQNDYPRYSLQSYRMFHSDPDISGLSRVDAGYSLGIAESAMSRRAGGGVANKATKLKHRKKTRAPDPPLNENFPRQYERRAQSSSDLRYIPDNADCRCVNGSTQEWAKTKCRAPPPPPPSTRVNPPPPPPPPLPAQTSTTCSPLQDSQNLRVKNNSEQPSTYRLLDSSSPETSYEKQCLPHDNWRLSRSVGDIRITNDQNFKSDSTRPTVFDSKNISNSNFVKKKPALLPHPPDPFQKEIQAVTRKIAHSQQRESTDKNRQTDNPQKSTKQTTPKPYYFSDKDVFKPSSRPQPKSTQELSRNISPLAATKYSSLVAGYDNNGNVLPQTKIDKNILENPNDVPSLQRFSPNRKRLKSPLKSSSPSLDESSNKDLQYVESYPHDRESDIDIRLRPVLPRKTLDIPTFSPIEAWHALGSDDQNNSNRSTSDESMHHHHYNEKSKRFVQNNANSKHIPCHRKEASFGECHWTPRQDLEDSDTSSLNSEEVVVPKNQLGEFSTRFSLPTVMFSNMRPIGADLPLNNKITERNRPNCFNEDTRRIRTPKEKPVKNLTSNADLNAVSHFKKFLGMRNKYLSEEDVSVSDSNWTFGGNSALQQKKGKHYSSDLMLSDKKKYELIMKNDFGDFLGDILVSKANDMRNMVQKSSDSGNSNFSFYSTEGHVMYLPDSDSHMSGNDSSPIRNRGRHDNLRKVNKTDQAVSTPKKYNKKLASSDSERRRGHELVRMLEDDARRRRNKEKISIRQQLQMMKRIDSDVDDEEEDEVDEAYFTEPKSLEEMSPRHTSPAQSHFHFSGMSNHNKNSYPADQARPSLTHWTSTPTLFYDAGTKSPLKTKGYHSNTSINSSPDCPIWPERQFGNGFPVKNQFMQNRRLFEKQRSLPEEDCLVDGRSSSEDFKLAITKDCKKISGQPTQIKDKKTHNIYKQLMDIVRKEERQLQKAQGNDCLSASRESSYSQRESSHSSTSSHDSVSSSSNSYTDSSDHRKHHREEYRGKSGVPANNEFHTSSGAGMDRTIGIQTHGGITVRESKQVNPTFHSAFAKPFTPNKSYKPVPFEVPVQTTTSNCRLLTVQEGPKVQVS